MSEALALLLLLLALGGAIVFKGVQSQRPKNLLVGSGILLLTGLFFALLSFWGEMLWFEELGQSQRFWTAVFAVGGFAVLGALVGGLGVFILTLPIPGLTPLGRVWPALAGALIGALWGCSHWQIILQYIYGVSTGIRDPILQHDTGFYLFTLPFYDSLYWGLLWTAVIALAAAVYLAIHTQSFDQFFSASSVIAFESSDRVSAHRIFSLPMAAIAAIPGANSRGRLAMAFRLAEVQDTLKTRKNRKPRSLHQSPLKVLSVLWPYCVSHWGEALDSCGLGCLHAHFDCRILHSQHVAFLRARHRGRIGARRHPGVEPLAVCRDGSENKEQRVLRFFQHRRKNGRHHRAGDIRHNRTADRQQPMGNYFGGSVICYRCGNFRPSR